MRLKKCSKKYQIGKFQKLKLMRLKKLYHLYSKRIKFEVKISGLNASSLSPRIKAALARDNKHD